MIEAISRQHDALRFQLGRMRSRLDGPDRELHGHMNELLADYCAHAGLSAGDAAGLYLRFVERYARHLEAFVATGRYPAGDAPEEIAREEYDVFLLASALLTPHRFRLMRLAASQGPAGGSCLVIGAGAGLEMLLVQDRYTERHAYDLSFSTFVRQRFPGWSIRQEAFTGGGAYDAAYAIEVLEHLENPLELLRTLRDALRPGGECHVTTARNVPQFDHLVNFSRPDEFEEALRDLGFNMLLREVVPHAYLLTGADADNVYYRLRKA